MTLQNTTRMEEIKNRYKNLIIKEGIITYYSKKNNEELFNIPLQNMEYLKNGFCVIRKNPTDKFIYQLDTERKIASLPNEAQVTIITENRNLKGFIVESFDSTAILDKDGRVIASGPRSTILFQATELLGTRNVYIKAIEKNGKKTFIDFQRNTLEIPEKCILDFENIEKDMYILLTNNEVQKWYSNTFRKVVEINKRYKIIDFIGFYEVNNFTKELPFGKSEIHQKIDYDDSEGEYRITKVYSPAGISHSLEIPEYDKLLNDTKNKLLYHIRPVEGRVEMYSYNSGNKVTVVTYIGYTHVHLMPILALNVR